MHYTVKYLRYSLWNYAYVNATETRKLDKIRYNFIFCRTNYKQITNENGGENVQMRDDGVIKRRKVYETPTGIVHTCMTRPALNADKPSATLDP